MKRLFLLLLLFLPTFDFLAAPQDSFVEGVHYQPVYPEVPTDVSQGKVEVVELFWYGCPHCYDIEPYINKWLQTKPESVEFMRLPATLNPGWVNHAKTYFALELLDELERIHPLMFAAIHDQGRRLKDLNAILRFLNQQGVDQDRFLEAYQSLEVQTRLRRAGWLNQQYGATGVPAVVVNGKYLTSARMAGSPENLFKVVDLLIKKELES
jgi:thiol:disulfide interchange protein DsbA